MIKINCDNNLTRESLIDCIPHFQTSLGRFDLARTIKWLLAVLWPAETSDSAFFVKIKDISLKQVELVIAALIVPLNAKWMGLVEFETDVAIWTDIDFKNGVLNLFIIFFALF